MATTLITGSNRGLGLEWVRQYAEEGWKIHATCRHPLEAKELQGLAEGNKNISIHRMDVTNPHEINALSVKLRNEPIDLLINNAGIYLEKYSDLELAHISYDEWLYAFQVNTIGAIRVTRAFQENLEKGTRPVVVIITSHMASIADIAAPGAYYYRSTKAALNAAMEGIAFELKPKGVGVLLLHPGWVRTRMGGEGAPLQAPESVRGMRSLVEHFDIEDSGRFFRYDGIEMPW